MLYAAIVEDEQDVADLIAGYLQKFGEENRIEIAYESFRNGIEFLEHYSPKFDIVFMDIQMPGIDGMQTAKELREVDKSVSLVFITNMAQFAIKGYEVDAVDFAVKPLSYFQFATKLKRIIGIVTRNKQSVCIKTEESLIALPGKKYFLRGSHSAYRYLSYVKRKLSSKKHDDEAGGRIPFPIRLCPL